MVKGRKTFTSFKNTLIENVDKKVNVSNQGGMVRVYVRSMNDPGTVV